MYAVLERMYLKDFVKIGTKIVNYTYVRIALGGVLEHFENQPHILNPQNLFFFYFKRFGFVKIVLFTP